MSHRFPAQAKSGALWLRKLADQIGARSHGRKRETELALDEVSTLAVLGVDGPGSSAAARNADALLRVSTENRIADPTRPGTPNYQC